MTKTDKLLLNLLKCAIKNEVFSPKEEITEIEFKQLFKKCEKHHILPLIYEAVYPRLPDKTTSAYVMQTHRRSVAEITAQTLRSSDFARLYGYLTKNQIAPLVLKGVYCRNLYPDGELRPSGDEDLLIGAENFSRCHELLINYGLKTSLSPAELDAADEITYSLDGSPLHIELHKRLFPERMGNEKLNGLFSGIFESAVFTEIGGTNYLTPHPTMHLLYLLCHSFKHFLHSGFGIRQVCDTALFAKKYEAEIDFDYIKSALTDINALSFAEAVFAIARCKLDICVTAFAETDIEYEPLLSDILESGAFGTYDAERLHSSNITLNAVNKGHSGMFKALFPEYSYLSARYPYLKKCPALLPIAWGNRIVDFCKNGAKKDPQKIISTGNERVALLKFYNIIK